MVRPRKGGWTNQFPLCTPRAYWLTHHHGHDALQQRSSGTHICWMCPLCHVLGWVLSSFIASFSLLCPFHRGASWDPERLGHLHKQCWRKKKSQAPNSTCLFATNDLTTCLFPCLPLTITLSPWPLKLLLVLFQMWASPRLWVSSQTPDKCPAAFLLLLLLMGVSQLC